MAKPLEQLEGTWEEILARAPELAGHRLRVTVLDTAEEPAETEKPSSIRPAKDGPSTAGSLLKYAGTWEGDDLEECLRLVYENRLKARF
jgi:hypothetical protein